MNQVLTVDIRCHELLNEIYCTPKVGVEIGVYKGQLSWRLLAANKRLFLYMVDPWREVSADDSWRTTDDEYALFDQQKFDEVMNAALTNVKPFPDRCKVLRMTSKEAAPKFMDGELDFVFIDGDHSYAGCKLDIDLWWPKIKPGGLLSGHDYRDDKGYGVKQAVHEFIAETGKDLRTGGNHTWFVTK